jgi:hypothetical protein
LVNFTEKWRADILYLEMCIEHLIYAKEALESSGTPFYLEEMKQALTRLLILETDIDNFASDNQNISDVSLVFRSPPKVQKKYADFEYVFGQIEGALVKLDVQGDFCEDEWFWLNEEMMEVTDMLVNLYEAFVAVKKIVDVLTSFNFTPNPYDFLTYYKPQFKDIIQKLKTSNIRLLITAILPIPDRKSCPGQKQVRIVKEGRLLPLSLPSLMQC